MLDFGWKVNQDKSPITSGKLPNVEICLRRRGELRISTNEFKSLSGTAGVNSKLVELLNKY
jgi:hypothetical protein